MIPPVLVDPPTTTPLNAVPTYEYVQHDRQSIQWSPAHLRFFLAFLLFPDDIQITKKNTVLALYDGTIPAGMVVYHNNNIIIKKVHE
jgi:hypothetical protein